MNRHTSLYLPRDILAELEAEARRLDRSVGWLLRAAWQIAKEEVRTAPASPVGLPPVGRRTAVTSRGVARFRPQHVERPRGLVYRCSLCGEAGHNIQTCPQQRPAP